MDESTNDKGAVSQTIGTDARANSEANGYQKDHCTDEEAYT
jgi:hypothetical protein